MKKFVYVFHGDRAFIERAVAAAPASYGVTTHKLQGVAPLKRIGFLLGQAAGQDAEHFRRILEEARVEAVAIQAAALAADHLLAHAQDALDDFDADLKANVYLDSLVKPGVSADPVQGEGRAGPRGEGGDGGPQANPGGSPHAPEGAAIPLPDGRQGAT